MTISKKWIRVGNIGCAVLLLVLLALQMFQPFWEMPACICTEQCTKAKSLLDNDNINLDCPACKGYADVKVKSCLWCKERPKTTQLEAKEVASRDTSVEWTITIQQYTWMPTFASTKGVTEYYQSIYNGRSLNTAEYNSGVEGTDYEFMVKDFVLMPVIVFFFGLIGGYFGLFQSEKPLPSIFGLVTGIWVVKDYMTIHMFQTGAMWQLHLGLGVGIILFALIPTAAYILRVIKWCNPNAAE